MWIWNADTQTFGAYWLNTSEATITLDQYGDQIVLDRADYAGNSPTLTAHYVGTRSGNGVSGSVTWTWNGNVTQGNWYASWVPGQGCVPAQSDPGPPAGGWQLGPMDWNECEPLDANGGCATWTWSDATQQFAAAYVDGGAGAYELSAYDTQEVIVDRVGGDIAAHYVGVRIDDDVHGSITYSWDGGTAAGTWSASW
jgi:hypothetical protein